MKLPFRTLPSTSFGRARSDEELATLQREHASLQHARELQRWVGDGALHLDLKRKGSHSDSQRRWEAVRERAGKKPLHQLSSPRLAGPEGPGQCHLGLAQIAPIAPTAARQIEPPLHSACSESLQGGALDSLEKRGLGLRKNNSGVAVSLLQAAWQLPASRRAKAPSSPTLLPARLSCLRVRFCLIACTG